jgi:SAM-dependent methyltransferase/methyltransferase-like protein
MEGHRGFRTPAGKVMQCPEHIVRRNDATGGGDYETLPYPSMPFAYSQPSHLEALACLYGFDAPAANQARVLELGCASGGNIVPLAKRFPRASFLGIDLSRRHIEVGRRRIDAVNAANIELRQVDLTGISLAEKFDYVICHGVFSWVPRKAQDAILRICNESLAANGIAAISYNVLPGWHLRRIVREICLHYVGGLETPHDRVAQARHVLDLTAKLSSQSAPYGLLLRNEAERMARMPAAYISGEFLTEDNLPCYFHEFIDRAAQNELGYLCEGDLASSISEILLPEAESRIHGLVGSTPLALEQYKDFVTGRTFRRSILIRTEKIATVQPKPSPDRLRNLHVASHLDLAHENDGQGPVYKDAQGRVVTAKDPAVSQALSRLAKAYPSTLSVKDLIDSRSGAAEARICDALFKLISTGQAAVSAVPQVVGGSTDERPRAWSVARAEAAERQPWITSLQHEAVPSHPITRFLLPYLDGENDRKTLNGILFNALLRGEIKVPELKDDKEQIDSVLAETIAARYITQTLSYLARHAVLEPN